MNFTVLTKTYKAPPVNEKEVLRYAGCKAEDSAVLQVMRECIESTGAVPSCKVCYCRLPLDIQKNVCDMGVISFKSRALAKTLEGCGDVLLFAATLGADFDRAISKALITSPARAFMTDALGTERIESLCDLFCSEFERENGTVLTPRFSPGYGDLDIDCQKDIFSLLELPKRIGLSLLDSMLMSPSKSVTAIAGIKKQR